MEDQPCDRSASAVERRRAEGAPRRVLLVGWDAADWQTIDPLIARGHMPTLAAFIERGVRGNLASMQPMLSPMLWNSIATGKRPDQHGIHGFTEPDPDGAGVRLVSSTSRRCKAIWNIATQAGLRSHVVGWYASHPAEPINGVMVSNHFEQLARRGDGLAPPPAGSVHPPELAERLAEFRVPPAEIDATAVLPFIPDAARLVETPGNRIPALRRLLSQTATVHATATGLLANDDWDFAAVYYEGIDRFAHEFMEFHPPKMDAVSQADFDAYRDCVNGIYRFHDMMLQAILELAGDETDVVLISDHGYYNDHTRPDPHDESQSPAIWHRPFGVFAASGPSYAAGARLYGANLLDIAPTLLHTLGLPAGADMPGRVLAEVLADPTPIERVLSWEHVEGYAGTHPAELRVDPAEARESLQQLVDLGYIEAPSADDRQAARDATFWNTLNLAQSLLHVGRTRQALDALETMDAEQAEAMPVRILRASCFIGLHDRSAARAELERLHAEVPDHPRVRFMLGTLEHAEGNEAESLAHLRAVARLSPRLPGLHNKLGTIYLAAGRHAEALSAFDTALEIDPESPLAFVGRARLRLETDEPHAAVDDAMRATELTHHLPAGHFVLARALIAVGRHDDAIAALRVCIAQAPQMPGAYDLLEQTCRTLGRTDEALDVALLKAHAPIPTPDTTGGRAE